MRIVDPNSLGNTLPVQTGRTGETQSVHPSGKGGSVSKAGSGASDSVQLSSLSGRISQSLETDSASRAHRVSQIAAAVQAGTYKVDASAVSRAIVDQSIVPGQTE